jgi:hypothetical protein
MRSSGWAIIVDSMISSAASCSRRRVNREYALGNTPPQRYMGEWSDRMPVRKLMIGLGTAAHRAGEEVVGDGLFWPWTRLSDPLDVP